MSIAMQVKLDALEKTVAAHAKTLETRVEHAAAKVFTIAKDDYDALLKRIRDLETRVSSMASRLKL